MSEKKKGFLKNLFSTNSDCNCGVRIVEENTEESKEQKKEQIKDKKVK